jgi:CrcB protein
MNRYLMVLLGAAVGGLARYVIGSAVLQRFTARFPESVFPMGTLVVNVTGCFLIGILMTLFVNRGDPNPGLRLLLVTGVLGATPRFRVSHGRASRLSTKRTCGSAWRILR